MAARPRRRVAITLAVLVLLGVAVVSASRATGWAPGPMSIVVSLMPFVAVVSVVGLLLAALSRRRWVVAAAVVLVVVNVTWQLPLVVADGPAAPGTDRVRVATINLKYGSGDAQAVVDLVRSQHIELLGLEELTTESEARLHEAGLDALLPYHAAYPTEDFTGSGLWSATPLQGAHVLPGYTSTALVATTTTARAGDLTVLVVHPVAPGPFVHDRWSSEYDALAADLAALSGPVLVLGDFNATRDQAPFRGLESLGYLDAADQAGAGFAPTFPVGRRLPAVAAIDHVLVRGTDLTATSLFAVTVPGSDHRALVVSYG